MAKQRIGLLRPTRFCETNSARVRHCCPKHTKAPGYSCQRFSDEIIMLGSQSLEGAPVHSFGLAARWVQDAHRPASEQIDVLHRHVEKGVAVWLGGIYSEAATHSWTDSALPSARTAGECGKRSLGKVCVPFISAKFSSPNVFQQPVATDGGVDGVVIHSILGKSTIYTFYTYLFLLPPLLLKLEGEKYEKSILAKRDSVPVPSEPLG